MLTHSIDGYIPAISQTEVSAPGKLLVLGVTQQHLEELRQALTLVISSHWRIEFAVYTTSFRGHMYDVILAFSVTEASHIFGASRISEVLRYLRTRVRDSSKVYVL